MLYLIPLSIINKFINMPYNFTKQIRVIIEKDEDGIYIASVPSLSGCHTQAKTYEKVVERIQQAAGLYLEVMRDKDQLKHLLAKREPSFLAVEDLAIRI